MFDLSNLNDFEFEMLCKDIMERKLSVTLNRFAKGRDKGIDLSDGEIFINHMIQVKHYINSKYSDLKSTLKSEIEKVKKHNPKSYYIFTSLSLTRNNKLEILKMFDGYINSISDIIDKNEIDDFLGKKENTDIVEKNYKLWLCASNILSTIQNQNIFIDCNEIIFDIEKYVKLFVTTNSYYDCKRKLEEKNIIIITGEPGVGKSTISKMLLLFYAGNDYIVRYVTDNNIKDIKKTISIDPTKKEIILLDDFLGQHYLKLNDNQPNELKTLISFIAKNPTKKLILNSRITILNEAKHSSLIFSSLMEQYEEENYLIDLSKMTYLEKAEILYNHLYFNDLPSDYFENIKYNKNYIKIVKHNNYNPRIIEYVTKKSNYETTNANNYYNYIKSKLDNPESVWEDEFRNRLDEIDRIFMNTLYSLTDIKIENSILESAFNKRIKNHNRDTTLNSYENTLKRLSNSLVRIIYDKNNRYIAVINPSINDYLKETINNNKVEKNIIVENSQYIEQIIKMTTDLEKENQIKEMILNNSIFDLSSTEYTIYFYYIKLITIYNIFSKDIATNVKEAFINFCQHYYFGFNSIVIDFLEKGFIDYYDLMSEFNENIKFIIKNMATDEINLVYKWHNQKIDDDLNEELIGIYKEGYINAIIDYTRDKINEDLQQIVSDEIRMIDLTDKSTPEVDEMSESDWKDYYIDKYYPSIKNKILDTLYDVIEEKTKDLPIEINDEEIDEDSIFYYFDIDEAIIYDIEQSYIDSKVKSENYTSPTTEWDIINKMFE
ncbi:restriction endonuclease [Mycoplasma sp. CAG:776]|nr:restriction endonuclease [Mycoplasma sp. CAG:776]